LFGWLHARAETGSSRLGCVICKPFGDEAIRAHRSIRHLATELARADVPTLRFDYDGTGDSAGHDLDPDRVSQWLSSIRFAATALREIANVERICFTGLRFGATLAALAASDYPETAGLAAIAPVISGRSYIRELRLLQKAIEAKRDIIRSYSKEGALETAGFLLTAATQASISAIDLTKTNLALPRRVLILDRAEMPGDDRWAQLVRDSGARIEHAHLPGYPEMMLDSHQSIVPREIIEATVSWARDVTTEYSSSDRGPEEAPQRLTASPPKTCVALAHECVDDPVTGKAPEVASEESAVNFGTPELFGIVTSPHTPARQPPVGHKAVLLLNSGAVHHIGPCRLYVALARHLARRGYVVLRMDIAGIGDSPPQPEQPENVVYPESALQDISQAIEYLKRQWGVSEVRALGLCSGAYHAFKAATAHFPLKGVVLINPLTFFWKEGMSLEYTDFRVADDITRYRKNVRRLASWRKLFAGGVDLRALVEVLRRHTLSGISQPLRAAARRLQIPLNEDLPTELLRAVRAGIDLHFIFAADDPGVELLRSKGGAAARGLQKRGKLGQELIPNADHTFTDLTARASLATLVIQKLGAA
jgi:dienelactone hydrolase